MDGNFSAKRQGWFALMRAMVLSENWDEIVDGTSLPVYDRPREQAWRHWAVALAYASKENVASATEEMKQMDAALALYSEVVKRKAPAEVNRRTRRAGWAYFSSGGQGRKRAENTGKCLENAAEITVF